MSEKNKAILEEGNAAIVPFAKNVGEIPKHADDIETIQPHYKF